MISTLPIRHAGSAAWRPFLRPVRSDWCERNLRIPAETGATPGAFDLDEHPYLREILDTVDAADVDLIVFIGATQLGKTELVNAIILSQGEVGRAPMMFAGPDRIYAREARDAIYARALMSKTIASRVPPECQWNDRHIDLEKCLIYLAWAGRGGKRSTQRLSGRACKIVLCSEVDRWAQPVSLAKERTKAFLDGAVVVMEGTPIGASAQLEAEYQGTDKRVFKVPCPQCGHYQELRFFPHRHGEFAGRGGAAGLQDAAGKWLSASDARQAAYYLCEHGCKLTDADKPGMVSRGVWCPETAQVTAKGKLVGPAGSLDSRRRGYRINSLYAPGISFGRVAEEYLLKRNTSAGLERFFNDWLGLAFIHRGKTPRWRDLGEWLAGAHPRGTIPRQAYFLTAGADVHLEGVWWIVRAWGGFKTSWLVDLGYLAKQTRSEGGGDGDELLASDLDQLTAAVLNRRWPVLGETPHGYSQLAVRLLGLDCGYRPTDVHNFIRAHPGGRAVAVYGDPHSLPGSLYKLHRLERNARTGKLYPEGTQAWGIDTNAYKGETSDRWFADRTQPGAWWLPENILETARGEDYLRQVVNERREPKPVHGRKVIQWEVISNETGSHCLDCEVYAAGLADMIVGGDWDPAHWGVTRETKPAGAGEQSTPERSHPMLPAEMPYGRPRS